MTDRLPWPFGVSEFTTQPWTFEQDVENYARLGVETIEVCEVKLDDARAAEQLSLVRQHGLAISSVQPVVRTLFPSLSQPEPKDVPARMARFRHTIERFAEKAQNVPFVTNTGIPPKGNIQQVLDTAATEYRALADFAQDHDVRVALEPLNASIMNEESAIWTLAQAMRIVEAVDRANFGICLDLWNIWQNANIAADITACGDRIFVVQVSDWRTPRSFEDRLIVGQGEIPLPPLLRAIYDSGYRGACSVEIFSHGVPNALWKADLAQVIQDSRAGLEAAWQAACAMPALR
ncbi:MAG TPA: sugar phosphate isomerase/epimerase family protein [Ktedonobacterales bacterium]|nr:sugar phosphate isomerase/epimerase family protein [Ktedonobacterales bacterium]